ncbi:MAG: PAS domain S-box protein [Acidobacteria bacterium]|nr:PAS domain S-box protein [Acidobacteriota bacterium]
MSNPRLPVLLATVDPSLAFLVQQALEQLPTLDLPVTRVNGLEAAIEAAAGAAYGLTIVEHGLLDGEPAAALARLRAAAPTVPLVIAGGGVEPLLSSWTHGDPQVEHLAADELAPRALARLVRGAAQAAAAAAARRLHETALHDARLRYRSLLSHSATPTWELDLSGVARFLEARRREGVIDLRAWLDENPEAIPLCAGEIQPVAVNDAALSFYGGGSADELTEAFAPWIVFGEREVFAAALTQFAADGAGFELEARQRTLAGEPRPVRLRVTTPAGYNGSLARVFVAIEDLRPLQRAEERVREAEDRVAAARAETAQATSRADGTEIRLGEAEEQLQRTERELHALQTRQHETRQEAERLQSQLAEVEQGLEESAQRIEETERRCAEEARRATLAAQDREYAEERLEAATRRAAELTAAYQALVRSIPIPVIACDATGTVTAWNAAAEKLFGWSAEEAIGSFNPTVAKEQSDEYRRELRARIESGATREVEVTGRQLRSGAQVDLKLSCVPLVGPAGETVGEVTSVLAARPARVAVAALA